MDRITKIKTPLVVFDFDGTICDSFEHMINALNSLSDDYAFRKVIPQEIPSLKNLETSEVFRSLGITWYQLPLIVSRMRKILTPLIHHMKAFEGLQGELDFLRSAGFSIGILTSNSAENVKCFLHENQLDRFDFIVTGSAIFGKARHLKAILRRNGLKDQTDLNIYVGDETRDVDAARATGYKSIAVSWGFNSASALARKHPDLLINNWKEIKAVANWLR